MRNREKQKKARKEERLENKNIWNINDPTPKQAVDNLIEERRKV